MCSEEVKYTTEPKYVKQPTPKNIYHITSQEYDDWKRSFENVEDMNKCLYFVLMKLNNDYNFVKRDIDNAVNWSNVIYDKDNDTFTNNWNIFQKLFGSNDTKRFSKLLACYDIFMKRQYKENKMIYINKYGFDNNKELMKEYNITERYESYSEIVKDIFDNKNNLFDNFCDSIYWGEMRNKFKTDTIIKNMIVNIGDNKSFYVLKIGKMGDFIKRKDILSNQYV